MVNGRKVWGTFVQTMECRNVKTESKNSYASILILMHHHSQKEIKAEMSYERRQRRRQRHRDMNQDRERDRTRDREGESDENNWNFQTFIENGEQ